MSTVPHNPAKKRCNDKTTTDSGSQLGPQFVLGDVSSSGVENIHDHLLSLQKSVGEELSRSNRYGSGGVLRRSRLVSMHSASLLSCILVVEGA